MSRKKCIQIARSAMGDKETNCDREKGYTFYHGLRVAKLTLNLRRQIPEEIEVDERLLFVGALFHDIAKGNEPHGPHGAVAIRELLAGQLTDEQLNAAGRIVREHNRRKKSRACWLASRIVQDADMLDHFGSHGMWLCMHYSASRGRTDSQTLSYYNSRENLAYQIKCRKALNFEISRLSFDRRIAVERQFMDRLAEEADGGV